ncbi:hypothetical protein Tsubulata_043961, partial [Turnera subulata]
MYKLGAMSIFSPSSISVASYNTYQMQKKLSMEKNMDGFPDQVNEDVMHNIFSRLPASSFASAACVNKYWNTVCTRILSRPKIASALSINPSLPDAVKEVLDKLIERLGSEVPIITNAASGIIGVDAVTDELREVKWESDGNSQGHDDALDRGIVLMVGFMPGLKISLVPLLRPRMAPHISLVEDFVKEIQRYTSSVSDCTYPDGIILFGETVIVGGASGCFLCGGVNDFRNLMNICFFDAVALVLAEDRHKPHGVGKTQFHVSLSTGIMPFGPKLRAACVEAQGLKSSWLTARIEGECGVLDWEGVLEDFKEEFDEDEEPDIYIGAVQHLGCSTGPNTFKFRKSLSFYEVLRREDVYLEVNGVGIKPGDPFLLYHSDPETATSSCCNAYQGLASLKQELRSQSCIPPKNVGGVDDGKEVLGGFIFSCNRRSRSFSGQPNADSFPFRENFPGVPLAGIFCSGEIGRASKCSMIGGELDMEEEEEEESCGRCTLHTATNERKQAREAGSFAAVNEDLIQDILKRLPAVSFASAACVSKTWNQICARILSKPKFASAISLNQSPQEALEEVVERVLSEPIRPDFAIASVFGSRDRRRSCFDSVRRKLEEKLGPRTPIIVASAAGIMGRDSVTNEFKEVMGRFTVTVVDGGNEVVCEDYGISLTIGFLPGLTVDVIAMNRPVKGRRASMATKVEDFAMDIRAFCSSASGCSSPPAIMLFVTIIGGNGGAFFLYRSCAQSRNLPEDDRSPPGAAALVFARNRNKPRGIGEIHFHSALSNGVSAIGPKYKTVSARESRSGSRMWLTAKREGQHEILGGNRILDDIDDELENRIASPDLYIGVTKRRNRSLGSEKPSADEEYLFADGCDIKTGDFFQIYHADPSAALSSCSDVSVNLKHLRLELTSENSTQLSGVANNVSNREFIGGFIFSCSGRGESFFGRSNTDSYPLLDNFPEVPLAGSFGDLR